VLGLIAWACCWAAPTLGAEDDGGPAASVPLLQVSRDLLRADRPLHGRDVGFATLLTPDGRLPGSLRGQLDLSPALDEIFSFFHRHGVPLQEQRDEHGHGPVGVYANFSVGHDMPAVSFHLGDRPIEPVGAFYSSERGFRCALVWPVSRLTLRLEGGEDSEFGYYAIAGLQWLAARRPLAIGIGLPMNLRDAQGGIGAVFQLRMNLD
jgi:hypothetical protein